MRLAKPISSALLKDTAEAGFRRTLTDVLRQEQQAQQISLFGSHARGKATTESDIDLLIIASIQSEAQSLSDEI